MYVAPPEDDTREYSSATIGICITAAEIGLGVGLTVSGGIAVVIVAVCAFIIRSFFKGLLAGAGGDSEMLGCAASALAIFMVTVVLSALCVALGEPEKLRDSSPTTPSHIYVRPYR